MEEEKDSTGEVEDVVNIPTDEEINQYRMNTISTEGDGTPETTVEEEPEKNNMAKYDLPKNRRNKTMRYGLKEVADVIFFDLQSDRPVLIFDTYTNAI